MKLLLPLAAVCLAHFVLAAPTTNDECPPKKDPCVSEIMDLSFVVDSSQTVTAEGFKQALNFLSSFLGKFDISPNKVRSSVITYGRGVYTGEAIGFSDYSDKQSLLSAINDIQYQAGGRTDTGAGLEYMLDNQMSQARENVKRVVVVLTDGDSQDGSFTKKAAQRVRDNGIEVFSIGVGPDIAMQELLNIASSPENVIDAKSYDSLNHILNQLRVKICEESDPEPSCRHTPTDLMFVIDSSVSVGEDDFELGLKFITNFLQNFEVNPSTIRVAAIMFGKRVYDEHVINFDDDDNVENISKAISALPWMHGTRTETGKGIDYMVEHFLPYTRPRVPKVAIVITDGESQNNNKTAAAAQQARANGIQMVAVGIGRARTEGGKLNLKELNDIAGSKSSVLLADNYADLTRIKGKLVQQTCKQIDFGYQALMSL
ncbi:cartilage matrix protein [Aplysia californica]|uniref:Cartilage matrix protein n=1 Tax=Aplysia californica TaxID=6500 RepID=A0ABM1A2B8_APLCA|nr:cartilage matrix protein [Aplysia californica]